ncbi:uncharacterized protein TNCV_2949671 [Trichonephila clavipes]|nr:uncharacterized protein TNCV_2949671 [Trichonephila clavipes]
MNSWKSFLDDITVQNVWKKIYTYGVKTNLTKRLEISGIEISFGNFTSSFEDAIEAVLRKSFPWDPNSHGNPQHRVLRSEAELVTHIENIRCISLLPCLGKCLEELCIIRLKRLDFLKKWLSDDQYAFTPQKSAEDALVRLCDMENAKTMRLLISLDIKGAFDNDWWPGILHLLKSFKVPKNIVCLIRSFLQCRSADLILGNVTKNRVLEKGCPQGAVMGHFLWNLIMNDLCTISKFQNCHKIAFADDVLLTVQCKRF